MISGPRVVASPGLTALMISMSGFTLPLFSASQNAASSQIAAT
jgi:hypothetical protein